MVSVEMQMKHAEPNVLNKRLDDEDYLAGKYSTADMTVWPWCREPARKGVDPDDSPNVGD